MIRTCLVNSVHKSLVQNLVYNTTKSRRQTTPRLFRNPKLTPRGMVQKQPKSYDYKLPQDLPNRHLYWDRSVMNKERRKDYNQQRLKKLDINAIHDEKGVRLYERQVPQILKELSDLSLIRNSKGRTLQNLRQIIKRFPKEARQSEREVVTKVIKELHDRFMASMSIYEFTSLCQVCHMMQITPSEQTLVHFYKFLEGAQQDKNNKIKLIVLCKMASYIFSRQYPQTYKEFLYVTPFQFKLFEDNPPRVKPLEHITPNIYTDSFIQQLQATFKSQDRKYLKNLDKIPGGSKLRQKIQATQ